MTSMAGRSANFHRLYFPPRIKVEEDFFLERTRALSEEYLELNSNWAEYVYGTSRFDYVFKDSDEFPDPIPLELVTNYNLSQFDNDLKGQIDQQTIQQFIQRMNVQEETTMDFEFTPISEISKLQKKMKIETSIPPPLDMIDCRYLKVSIDSLSIDNNGQLNEIEEVQGVLFMYDHQEQVIASEPIYFNHTFGETSFDQTNQQIAYLECRKPSEVLSLVCILMNQAAYPLDEFISYLQNHTKNDLPRPIPKESPRMSIPFALSFVNLSGNKGPQKYDSNELKFPLYWIKYTSSEVLQLIGKPNPAFNDENDNSNSEVISSAPSIATPKQKKATITPNANTTNNQSQHSATSSTNSTEDVESALSNIYESPNNSAANSTPCITLDNTTNNSSGYNSSNNQIGLGTNSPNPLNYIKIKCETSIDIIDHRDEMQKLEFCISTDAKREGLPMLAESAPHTVGLSPMDISLSNIKLDFNSSKKADFVYFKAYFCEEEQADPLKPSLIGTGHFISKKYSEEYQNVFISSPLPYSKHLIFSDFVKIYVPNPLKYTAHIIIHVFLVLKGNHSLCRVGILPLFENISNEVSPNYTSTNINIPNPPTFPITLPAITSNNSADSFATNSSNLTLPSSCSSINSATNVLNNNSSNNDPSLPLPSFPKPTPFQSTTITLSTINPSQIKSPDYLQKFKASSKTSLTITIEMPSMLFPPKVISEFAAADSPDKMNINEILDLDEKVIKDHFIPIIAKFLSLMSPLTAEYLIKFYSKSISNNSEIKTQLRSWIYHNLDVTTIKQDFLTAFTSSFEILIKQEINNNNNNQDTSDEKESTSLLKMIMNAIDIITDIFWVSCLRKTEENVPDSVHEFLSQISQMIIYSVKQGNKKQQEYINLSYSYGRLLFLFGSFSKKDTTTCRAIFNHLRLLLDLDQKYQIDALVAFFEFMIQFTFNSNLAHQMVIQIPVKPLTTIMFSPYQTLLSFLILAFYRSLQFDDITLHSLSCSFVAHICLPLETNKEFSMVYRSAYAFFPFLNIISNYYENYINEESKFELLPAILFLITYTPSQLLKNYFNTIGKEFQVRFIDFMKASAVNLIRKIERETSLNQFQSKEVDKEKVKSFYGIALFKDLTQRFLQFLRFNFSNLNYCISSVVSLLDILINTPYQTPRNFPKLFDFVRLLISSYPLNRPFLKCLLKVITSPQHIARCFGTTLIALFFQSDFANRKNVNKSSVEFLDTFTSSLLHVTPSKSKISLYKKMIIMCQRLISEFFKNAELTQRLSSRLTQAFQIIEMFEKLIASQESAPDLCILVMKIADANKNFPSMRMKWLKKIVIINIRNGWYNAAFVAQLHICALISTVVLNKDKIEYFSKINQNNALGIYNTNNTVNNCNNNENLLDFGFPIVKNLCQNLGSVSSSSTHEDETPFNLIITRPFLKSGNYIFSETEFKFIPSVLVETTIDFDSLNPDFYILLPDFTIELLKKNLKEAVRLGLKAKMHYDVRCILSILLRIAIAENDGEMITKITSLLKQCYNGVLATNSFSSGCSLSFFAKDDHIFCVDEGKTIEGGIPVNRFDKRTRESEQNHCFSIYRTKVTENDLDNLSKWKTNQNENDDSNDNHQFMLQMTQYTTTNALPRYTIKSEIIDSKTVSISFPSYVKMEEERYNNMIDQISSEFERCYSTLENGENCNDIKPKVDSDLDRIYGFLFSFFEGKMSLFNLLKLLAEYFSPTSSKEIAIGLRPKIEKLVQIYHTYVELIKSIDAKVKFQEIVNLANSFTSAFQLQDIDITCYSSGKDPLSNINDYEIF
ncbi:hypothetical protein M9Y10_004758 [Tritrichomonas musculus]|uniref:DOCKER domain-containing protein n=1 Tax=Tritrichomonas musculus TaxID=1915356 RepID=A0ABR2JJU4_9EUKA